MAVSSNTKSKISIGLCLNTEFLIPASVTLRSAIENLPSDKHLEIIILHVGLTPVNRKKLESSLPSERVTFYWYEIQENRFKDFPLGANFSFLTYARLVLPDFTPIKQERLIYLDCDLVIEADLSHIWEIPFEQKWVLACASHELNKKSKMGNVVTNTAKFGVDPDAPYFNAGLLVLNLQAWRQHNVGSRCIDLIRKNPVDIVWWDQDALNIICYENWKELDIAWNVQRALLNNGNWSLSQPSGSRKLSDGNVIKVIHFNGSDKPWFYDCSAAFRERFFFYLKLTSFKDWKPNRLEPIKRKTITYFKRIKRILFQPTLVLKKKLSRYTSIKAKFE